MAKTKLTPDIWIDKYFGKEYFSGEFLRLQKAAKSLGLIPLGKKIITIAGTNGKGQTARMLCSLLNKEGVSYCLWTSPHLKKINERFVFNNRDIDDDALLIAFIDIYKKVQDLKLSYFEFLYLVFLKLVQTRSPSVVVQEVGLGGRLDATNIIDADIACITSISRDHQEILGSRFQDILFEKAGVFRSTTKVVTNLELKFLRQKLHRLRGKNHWYDLFEKKVVKTEDHYSKRNALLAVEIFYLSQKKKLGIELIENFEVMRKKLTIGDALYELFPTHNVDGLRKLVQFLKQEQYTNYNTVLFGPSSRAFEDLQVMAKILIVIFGVEHVKLTKFDHYKSLGTDEFNQLKSEFNFGIIEDIQKFKSKTKTGKFLVLGSNYFLGSFLSSEV